MRAVPKLDFLVLCVIKQSNPAKRQLNCAAPGAAAWRCGRTQAAGQVPSGFDPRFDSRRSGPVQSGWLTLRMRLAPHALHRMKAMASWTRVSSPCRSTWAETGTSREWPQPRVIRSMPPRRRPSRRPSRPGPSAPARPAPAGRSWQRVSRTGSAAPFEEGNGSSNLVDASRREVPPDQASLERVAITAPLPVI